MQDQNNGTRHLDPGSERISGTKLRLLVRILTPLFIAGLAVGAMFDYIRSTSRAEEQFNQRQAFMSFHAADRLSAVFQEIDKLLNLLEHAGARGERALANVVGHLSEHGAMAGMMLTAAGDIAQISGARRAKAVHLIRKLSPCRIENKLRVEGPLRSDLSPNGWLLVASMLQGKAGSDQWCVMLLLDWARLRASINKMAQYGSDTLSWVLDGQGRLIMHSDHHQKPSRLPLVPGKTCTQCHSSFDLHRDMTSGIVGTRRLQVPGQKAKLVAFAPVRAGSSRWSLAVATPADHVTRDARRDLWATILFTAGIMLVMVGGALVLDREATRRIRQADRFNKVLEAKVNQRTDELAALHRRYATIQAHHTRLERVAVAGEMAAIVAHEIRTPLNVLSMNAQMINHMLSKISIPNQDQIQQILQTHESEIERINQLVQENLLAHVRSTPAELEPLRVDRVLSESVRFMEPEAQRNQVDLQLAIPLDLPEVLADESKLRQVLLNIILNGIQATAPGGEVCLMAAQEGRGVQIQIQDDGPGLSTEKLDQVFKPFMTTKKDGTGLGLAICARLVKEMEGEISFCSQAGQGACFQVVLPVARRSEET